MVYVGNESSERLRILVKDQAGNVTDRMTLPAGLAEAVEWADCRAGLIIVDVAQADSYTEVTREDVELCEGDTIPIDHEYVVDLECGVWYRKERPDEC